MTKPLRYTIFIILCLLLILYVGNEARKRGNQPISDQAVLEKFIAQSSAPVFQFKVVKEYPHYHNAFTEGLLLDDGYLYESTGLYYQSKISRRNLENGKILNEYSLPDRYFGEGIGIIGNNLYQLTYKEKTGFIYDKKTFKLLSMFHYPTEGWGLTSNGSELIMSDGSPTLHFLDPHTFKTIRVLAVHDQGEEINHLNELEYVDGKIYANIWPTDIIAIISPATGQVEGWINIKELDPHPYDTSENFVSNGIAYDEREKTLLVTGKYWPHIYAIQLLPSH